MLDIPKKCYVNKFLPKKIFYEKIALSQSVKEEFTNQVDRLTWLYKISPDTIGINKTDNVEEIEVFQLDLKEKMIPKNVIKVITKGIPYKILFVIKFNDDFCYSVKVDDIFTTEWNDNINFVFNAINLEIVYENIVKSILKEESNNKKIDEIIDNRAYKADLEKRINQLKQKIKNEKQFNKKVELNKQLNELLLEEKNV